jgi:hypothetical protein
MNTGKNLLTEMKDKKETEKKRNEDNLTQQGFIEEGKLLGPTQKEMRF